MVDRKGSVYINCCNGLVYIGSVAQLAERALRMREAPGSKPGVSIRFFRLAVFLSKRKKERETRRERERERERESKDFFFAVYSFFS
jgi:predicted GIY-YIG superfamily endonuclease